MGVNAPFPGYRVLCRFSCEKGLQEKGLRDPNSLRKHYGRVHNIWSRLRKYTCDRCHTQFDDQSVHQKHEQGGLTACIAASKRHKPVPVKGTQEYANTFAYTGDEVSQHLRVYYGAAQAPVAAQQQAPQPTGPYPGAGGYPAAAQQPYAVGDGTQSQQQCLPPPALNAGAGGYPFAAQQQHLFAGNALSFPQQQYPQNNWAYSQQAEPAAQMTGGAPTGMLQGNDFALLGFGGFGQQGAGEQLLDPQQMNGLPSNWAQIAPAQQDPGFEGGLSGTGPVWMPAQQGHASGMDSFGVSSVDYAAQQPQAPYSRASIPSGGAEMPRPVSSRSWGKEPVRRTTPRARSAPYPAPGGQRYRPLLPAASAPEPLGSDSYPSQDPQAGPSTANLSADYTLLDGYTGGGDATLCLVDALAPSQGGGLDAGFSDMFDFSAASSDPSAGQLDLGAAVAGQGGEMAPAAPEMQQQQQELTEFSYDPDARVPGGWSAREWDAILAGDPNWQTFF